MPKPTEFRLAMPFVKVDKEKRIVSGFATTEDVDKQNEVVDYAASKEAFKDWTGNIREMHEPKAVGKAVSWRPDDEHKGVYVDAYVSKGAEDTWQKILDGTLKGFSIGGQTVNKIQQIVKDAESGSQKHVTRITKYKLTELSLVDNPANPEATFELVKFVDGVPTQTKLVEDIKKVVVSESVDILADEVKEHESKAESLSKKVLGADKLTELSDDQWGVVRKYNKGETQYIERLLPMPDKVHAVRALSKVEEYNLSKDEREGVERLAKSILGSDYEVYSSNRGGETKKMNKEFLEALQSLTKAVQSLEERFSKANMDKDSKVETQETGNTAPNDGSTPEGSGKFEGEVPAEGTKQTLEGSKPAKPDLKTQEEGNVAPVKKDEDGTIVDEEKKKDEEKEKEEEAPVEKAKNPATSSLKTQDDEHTPPVKKSADDEKVTKEFESLRKRIETLESRPKPRKHKIEKIWGASSNEGTESNGLDTDLKKAADLRKAEQVGKILTPDEKRFIEDTFNKSINSKFGKAL